MSRRLIALLAICAMSAAALVNGPGDARADRPLSDITCATGERATYDHGKHRFPDGALILGCARLAGGSMLQLDIGPQDRDSASTCLWLSFGPPRRDGLFTCARRLGSEPRVLLILRHRSQLPTLVVGVAPADAERVALRHANLAGARGRTNARLIPARERLAQRAGARDAFAALVAELSPAVDVCAGIRPRSLDPAHLWSRGTTVTPSGRAFGRPDGWLAGFSSSYGIGYGPGGAPKPCHGAPWTESRGSQPPALGLSSALELFVAPIANLVRSIVVALAPMAK